MGGEFADFGLSQTKFLERCANLELCGGLCARAEIAYVAGVLAISDHVETFSAGEWDEFGKEFVLAEVAAVVGVGEVIRILEFLRFDHANGEAEIAGKLQSFVQFAARQAGRISDDSEGLRAEHLMRDAREKRRIDAAGIRD